MSVRLNYDRLARTHKRQRKLTYEQVREARLSLEPSQVFAARFEVSLAVLGAARRGDTYGPLTADERRAMNRRDGTDFLPPPPRETLAVGRTFPVTGRPDLADRFDRVAMLDAAHECEHGRLPTDRVEKTNPCGCWTAAPKPQEAINGSNGAHQRRLGRFQDQVREADQIRPASGPNGADRNVDHSPALA